MKYYKVNFTISCQQTALLDDCRDLVAALAGEAGFETFEETEDGLCGYVQQALFERETLDEVLTDFPIEAATISYNVSEAEDQDWNATWEAEGFEPIVVGPLVVHDGRHLPDQTENKTLIEIDAQLAFGTGTHETTQLMLGMLCAQPLANKTVLDCGTGTGILAIAALKQGAQKVTAYDIDEWSVDNARHNAIINMVDERLEVLHGDAHILDHITETFDVALANINRNILLEDMPRFANKMKKGSKLILSGFYKEDIPLLEEKAATLFLQKDKEETNGEWASLEFTLQAHA